MNRKGRKGMKPGIRLALLGPDGTFTAEAGMDYIKRRGISAEIKWYRKIEDCFDAVEKQEADRAMVPILNSTTTAAWINETLKKLRDNHVMIYDEYILPIRHHLAALPGAATEGIRYVHSKDKAFQQCENSLSRLFKDVDFIYENSTAAAAQTVKGLNARDRAAVAPFRAVELYGLEILEKDIQDDPRNKTRFIAVSYTHLTLPTKA